LHLVVLEVAHLVAETLIAQIAGIGWCDHELGCILHTLSVSLVKLLSELVLALLLDHLSDLLVASLDVPELNLVSAGILFKLLLFTACLTDISGAGVDSRLDSQALLSKWLLAAVTAMEVDRCVGSTGAHALTLYLFDASSDLANSNPQLLLLCSELIQLLDQLHILF
jgi:hypothetical protein